MNSTKINQVVQVGSFSLSPSDEQQNQDSIGNLSATLAVEQDAHIFVIADGMGGHSLGDAASYFAVNYVLKWWRSKVWMNEQPDDFLQTCKEQVIDLFQEINERLIEVGKREQKEIGTTLSVLILVNNQYFVCHIGDTRIYRYREKITEFEDANGDTIDLNREKKFLQLTVDHSFASMQIEKGLMTEEEARSHKKAHHLTQCMGIKGEVEPYTASGSFTSADYFLLCTDGFYTLWTDDQLSKEWTAQLETQQTVEAMTDHFYHLVKKQKQIDDAPIITVNMGQRTEEI